MSADRRSPSAVVVGPIGRDLVLLVDDLPEPGTAGPVRRRLEMLGGKGANQAVAFARLHVSVSLVGVVGQDTAGDEVLAQAAADGIDVDCVVRRQGAATGLIVEVLDREHRWRYLQDTPDPVQPTVPDILAARSTIARAASVIVQLQQPAESALAAARTARGAGCRVVLDGAPQHERQPSLLGLADVLRVDAHEAELLTGASLDDVRSARQGAQDLLRRGPDLVALAVEGAGNLFAWPEGYVFYPLDDVAAIDTTGAGDALVAALVTALDRGLAAGDAGRWAVAAASLAVEHAGGRPDMSLESLQERAARQHPKH